jgi:hypothetical protein
MTLDPGALTIRRLLTADDPALRRGLRALARSLMAMKPLPGKPGLDVPDSAGDAVAQLRSRNRAIKDQIAAVHTAHSGTQHRILAALDALDLALAMLARSVDAKDARRAAELARNAYWQRAHAHTALEQAIKELR